MQHVVRREVTVDHTRIVFERHVLNRREGFLEPDALVKPHRRDDARLGTLAQLPQMVHRCCRPAGHQIRNICSGEL